MRLSSPIPRINAVTTTIFAAVMVIFALNIAVAHAADDQEAELLVLELTANDDSSIAITLGKPEQKLTVLPILTAPSAPLLQVPLASLCDSDNSSTAPTWNPIQSPLSGDVITVNASSGGDLASMYLISWTAAKTESQQPVNITLRKGDRNITSIDTDVTNDGEYAWDAVKTFEDLSLDDGSDYALMVWMANPPQRSVSGFFTLRGNSSYVSKSPSEPTVDEQKSCQDFLSKNGGYYNQTADKTFTRATAFRNSANSGSWEIGNTGTGTTTLGVGGASVANAGVNMLTQTTLGRGTLSLTSLQLARGAKVERMNMVSIGGGAAVLGGYDSALVDTQNSRVFKKEDSGILEAQLVAVNVGDNIGYQKEPGKGDMALLAYDYPGITLPQDSIDKLLPYIGSPEWSEDAGGYVYASDPPTDWTLHIMLHNGSAAVSISIPASSLILSPPAGNNPLTPTRDGHTFLALAPSTSTPILGRAFLRHIYTIDSPASISKFLISPLPSSLPSPSLVAASPASLEIFNGTFPAETSSGRTTPSVGPMVGGIVGGLVVLCALGFVGFRAMKRRHARLHGAKSFDFIDAPGTLEKETPRWEGGSIRTTQTIPIHYSPSPIPGPLAKELTVHSHPVLEIPPPPQPRLVHIATQSLRDYTPSPPPQRTATATVARVYSADAVATVRTGTTPPLTPAVGRRHTTAATPSPPPQTHARTASVGRVVTPASVFIAPSSSSRRSDSAGSGSSAARDVLYEEPALPPHPPPVHRHTYGGDDWKRLTGSSKALPSPFPQPSLSVSEESAGEGSVGEGGDGDGGREKSVVVSEVSEEDEEVFGLRAVARDAGEFMTPSPVSPVGRGAFDGPLGR
ncbi:hypothetical protein EDC01DRAFT_29981 [Geopyxis carbonaria]|nr:hypothetical protein EDC01DRAFT_29981 [Geopyxis carbonaria]